MLIALLIVGWLACGFGGLLVATQELRRDIAPTHWTFWFEDRFGYLAVALGLLTLVVASSRYVGIIPVESRHH